MPDLLTLSAAPYQANNTSLAELALQGIQISNQRKQATDALVQQAYQNVQHANEFSAEMTIKNAELGLKEREANRLENQMLFTQQMDQAKFSEGMREFGISSALQEKGLDLQGRSIDIQAQNADLNAKQFDFQKTQWEDPTAKRAREAAASSAEISALAGEFSLDQAYKYGDVNQALKVGTMASEIAKNNADAAWKASGGAVRYQPIAKNGQDLKAFVESIGIANDRLKSIDQDINKYVMGHPQYAAAMSELSSEDPKMRAKAEETLKKIDGGKFEEKKKILEEINNRKTEFDKWQAENLGINPGTGVVPRQSVATPETQKIISNAKPFAPSSGATFGSAFRVAPGANLSGSGASTTGANVQSPYSGGTIQSILAIPPPDSAFNLTPK